MTYEWNVTELYNELHLGLAAVRFSTPVTGLAASFGSVTAKPKFKKCVAYFLKEAKAAAFQSYPLPFGEGLGVRFYAARRLWRQK